MCGQALKIKWFIHTLAEKNIVFLVSALADVLYVCCLGCVTCRSVIPYLCKSSAPSNLMRTQVLNL